MVWYGMVYMEYDMVYIYVVWYPFLLATQRGRGERCQSRPLPYFSQRLQKFLNISSRTHRPDCSRRAFLQFSYQKAAAAAHKLAKSQTVLHEQQMPATIWSLFFVGKFCNFACNCTNDWDSKVYLTIICIYNVVLIFQNFLLRRTMQQL